MTEQRLNLTTAVCHAKNQNILILDTMNYDVLANWKASRANAEVVVTGAAYVRMAGKKKKPGR